jgi:hypothetical protein
LRAAAARVCAAHDDRRASRSANSAVADAAASSFCEIGVRKKNRNTYTDYPYIMTRL